MNRFAFVFLTAIFSLVSVDAFALYRRAKPTNLVAKTMIKRAELALLANRKSSARRFFERAARAKGAASDRSYAATQAAILHVDSKRTSRAVSLLRRALRLSSTNAQAHQLLGQLWMEQAPGRAAVHLSRAVELTKRPSQALQLDVVRALAKAGKISAAQKHLRDLTERGIQSEQLSQLAAELAQSTWVAQTD